MATQQDLDAQAELELQLALTRANQNKTQQENQKLKRTNSANVNPVNRVITPNRLEQGQSSVSSGIPQQAYRYSPRSYFRQLNKDISKNPFIQNVVSFAQGAVPPLGAIAGLVQTGMNPESGYAPDISAPPPGGIQDQFQRAAQNRTISNIVGGIASPVNVNPMLKGMPLAGKMATGASAGAINAGVGAQSQNADPSSAAIFGAGLGVALPAAGVGGMKLMDVLAAKMTPKALSMVRSMADYIISSKAQNASKGQLTKNASNLGLANQYQDILYSIINYLNPRFLQSSLSKQMRSGDIVRQAGQQVGQAWRKADQLRVPATQLSPQLQDLARRRQLGTGLTGGAGSDTAAIIRNQFNKTPTAVAQATRPKALRLEQQSIVLPQKQISYGGQRVDPFSGEKTIRLQAPYVNQYQVPPNPDIQQSGRFVQQTNIPSYSEINPQINADPNRLQRVIKNPETGQVVERVYGNPQLEKIPLGQLRKTGINVKAAQFKPAYQLSNPKVAPLQATSAVQDYMMSKAGYTQPQRWDVQKANALYTTKAKAHQLFMNNQSRPNQMFNQIAPQSQLRSFGSMQVRQKGGSLLFQGSKQLARRAMARLDQRYGTGQYNDMSAFEIDSIRNKLQAISNMDPKQGAAFAYAQSMMNPVFRRIWNDRNGQQ